MIVMADVGTIPAAARAQLVDWVRNGGTLVRFAGTRLIAAGNDEELLPVRLRLGERSLGGALSWTTPQPVTEFPPGGPFADLTPPLEVTVSRQVLAEPTPDIVERTWASLADGTPLVTGARRDKGNVVLFHITPAATWSNLPIPGTFVEMLRRVVQMSRNQGSVAPGQETSSGTLAPFRMIAADGRLVPPGRTPSRSRSAARRRPSPSRTRRASGGDEGVLAHNLLPADARLAPIARPQTPSPVTELRYAFDQSRDMKGPLVAAALALMVLDTLAVFWMGGVFSRRRRPTGAGTATAAVLLALILAAAPVPRAEAQDAKPGDVEAVEAISVTHLAYVLTGNSSVDWISRAGLAGLTDFSSKRPRWSRRAGRRRHRPRRARFLSADLLADRRQRADAFGCRDRPRRTPT